MTLVRREHAHPREVAVRLLHGEHVAVRAATEAGVVSDARLEDFEALSARYEPPDTDEAGAFLHVESGPDLETTLARTLVQLVDRHFVAPP